MNQKNSSSEQSKVVKPLEGELLSAIIDTIDALLIVLDHEGRIVRFNHACEKLTGYSFEEVQEKRFWDFLVTKDEMAGVRASFQELSSGNFPNKHENQWIDRNGEGHLISWSNTAVINSENEVEYVIGTGIEITEQRKAEESLQESENRYQTVISTMSEGVVLQNAKGEIIACNTSAEKILGLPKEQLVGLVSVSSGWKTIKEDGSPFPAENYPAFVTLQRGKPCKDVTMGVYRPDDNLVWISINTQPVFKDDAEKPSSVVISFSDITERKRALEEMWYIKRAIEWTSDAIKMSDTARQSVYHNRAFRELLGYTPKELNELGGSAVLYTNPEIEEKISRVLAGGKSFQDEVELRCKSGEIIPVEMTADAVRDDAGRLIGLIAIYNDIRERRRIEQQIRQTLKMEAIGRLAGGVAHDFNNMLTAISGYSDLSLRLLREDDDTLAKNIREIKKAAERSADLTGKLLAFSRRQVQKLETLNINRIIEDLKGMLERLLGEDLEFVMNLAPDLRLVKADAGQIEQVLMNLVVNARDAMPAGGKIIIETKNVFLDQEFVKSNPGSKTGAYVLLSISDTGTGMDAETRVRIFEPFFTTKEAGKGTGLGLATVYGIVKQSGGYIAVQTEVKRGTSFKIYLPQADVPAEPVNLNEKKGEVLGGNETILLAEDEELVRNLAREVLELSGYRVLTADSGEEALQICLNFRNRIDLLISDIVMPGISGRKLAELAKPFRPEMKILLISGYSNETSNTLNKTGEEFAFLEKPFMPETLMAKVREVIKNKM